VFTARPGVLTNDWFVNLLGMETQWRKASAPGLYEGVDRAGGQVKWTASPVDLVFGSHSELRAVAEVYASTDGHSQMVRDFASAWAKVMNLGRCAGGNGAPVGIDGRAAALHHRQPGQAGQGSADRGQISSCAMV
jgi:catalase (peroxidase I)